MYVCVYTHTYTHVYILICVHIDSSYVLLLALYKNMTIRDNIIMSYMFTLCVRYVCFIYKSV